MPTNDDPVVHLTVMHVMFQSVDHSCMYWKLSAEHLEEVIYRVQNSHHVVSLSQPDGFIDIRAQMIFFEHLRL